MRAIRVESFGGPEVLAPVEVAAPEAGAGEVVVSVDFAGVNFIDVYHRTGLYPMPLPFIPGQEGAGVVRAVGRDVATLRVGAEVAWVGGFGSYAERAVIPASALVAVPEGIGTEAWKPDRWPFPHRSQWNWNWYPRSVERSS